MKILIADDEPAIHDIYTRGLEENHDILNAYDGNEAQEMAIAHKPDLILLDISMPGRDGRDICKQLKSSTDTQHIYIIMLTGRDALLDRQLGIELGADGYLEKPCPVSQLEQAINKIARKMQCSSLH